MWLSTNFSFLCLCVLFMVCTMELSSVLGKSDQLANSSKNKRGSSGKCKIKSSDKCRGKFLCVNDDRSGDPCSCYSPADMCDGVSDCPNGDDEIHCPCEPLLSLANGWIDYNGVKYNLSASFNCLPGFTLTGDQNMYCSLPGKWIGNMPECLKKDCGELADPDDGHVSYFGGTVFQSVASFSCDEGFTLDGPKYRTCQASGSWDSANPTCTANECCNLTTPPGGTVSITGTSVNNTATFACDPGQTLVCNPMLTCGVTGEWSWSTPEDGPSCTTTTCPTLFAPTNGFIARTDGNNYQSVATFTCSSDYDIVGISSVTCQLNGEWSGQVPPPYCKLKDCGPLSRPDNGYVEVLGGTTVGSVASYGCFPGHTTTGSATRTCQQNKSWSNAEPSCSVIDCGPLTVKNGVVTYSTGTTTYESVATFTCNSPYVLSSATTTRTCTQDGVWDNASPTCSWLLFRGTTGNQIDPYLAWTNSDPAFYTSTEGKCSILEISTDCDEHFRNPDIDTWAANEFDTITFALFKDDKMVQYVTFDAANTDYESWFAKENIKSSSWETMKTHTYNYFSLIGHPNPNRRFMMNKNYGGCGIDRMYSLTKVAGQSQPCNYDKDAVPYPQYLYSPTKTHTAPDAEAEGYDTADFMAIIADIDEQQ